MASSPTTPLPSDLPSLTSTIAGTSASSSMPTSPTSPAPISEPQITLENGNNEQTNGDTKEAIAQVVDEVKDELITEGESDPEVSCRIRTSGRRGRDRYERRWKVCVGMPLRSLEVI